MYLCCEHAHRQNIGLETFWNESILVEIKVNRGNFLTGFFYIPQTVDAIIFDALNKMQKCFTYHQQYNNSGRYE